MTAVWKISEYQDIDRWKKIDRDIKNFELEGSLKEEAIDKIKGDGYQAFGSRARCGHRVSNS